MNHRVCFVAPFGLGHKTTVWARTLPLARTLTHKGWSATILIPPWDTPGDSGRRWLDDGVSIVNVELSGGMFGVTFRLLHELSGTAPDIIHIVKPRNGYFGRDERCRARRRLHCCSTPTTGSRHGSR
jgi:hypothetical protein